MERSIRVGVLRWAFPPVASDKLELFYTATPELRREYWELREKSAFEADKQFPEVGEAIARGRAAFEMLDEVTRRNECFDHLYEEMIRPFLERSAVLYGLEPRFLKGWCMRKHDPDWPWVKMAEVREAKAKDFEYFAYDPPPEPTDPLLDMQQGLWRLLVSLTPSEVHELDTGDMAEIKARARALRSHDSALREWLDANLTAQLKDLARDGVATKIMVGYPWFLDLVQPTGALTLEVSGFYSLAETGEELLSELAERFNS